MKLRTTTARLARTSLLTLVAACSGGGGDGGGGALPDFLGFSVDPAAYRAGFSVVSNAPLVTGTVDSWTVTPALPAGLTLDPVTGLIAGAPSTPAAPTVYQVGATNAYGTTTRAFHLLVTEGEDGFVVTVNTLSGVANAYVMQGDVLRHNGFLPVGTSPLDAVAAPAGSAVVIPNADSDDVSVLLVDKSSGRLTEAAGSPFATGVQPTDAAVSAAGDLAWVLAAAGGTGAAIHQYALDGSTGVLTPLAPASVPAGDDLIDLEAASDGGQLYALAGGVVGELRAFDVASDGTLTAGATTPVGTAPAALALHPFGEFLYVANGDGTVSGFARDTSTGALTELAGSPYAGTLPSYVHIALALDGGYLFAVSLTGAVDSFDVDFLGDETGVAGALHQPVAVTLDSGPGTAHVALGGDGDRLIVTNTAASRVSLMSIAADGTLTRSLPPHSVARNGPAASCVIGRATLSTFVGDTLYSANRGSNDVSQFTRATEGTLTAIAPPTVATGNTPSSVEVHPFLDALYVVNLAATTKAIEVFSLAADGNATWTQDVAQPTNGLWSIAVEPSGRFAYAAHAADSELHAFGIGPGGTLTPSGPAVATGNTPRGTVVHPAGGFLYVPNSLANTISMYAIDPSTGALTTLTPSEVPSGTGPAALAIDPAGEFLYCANSGASDSISMFAIDATTGLLTELSTSPYVLPSGKNAFDLLVHTGGRVLFATMRGDSTLQGFLINRNETNSLEDGTIGLIATESLIDLPSTLRQSPDGSTLYVSIEIPGGLIQSYTVPAPSSLFAPLETTASGPMTSGLAIRSRVE